jgi:hypothetical protein
MMSLHQSWPDIRTSLLLLVVVGTLLPLYISVVAVCTPGEEDDTTWLNYWVASGVLSYCTEWIDEISENFPNGGEHW